MKDRVTFFSFISYQIRFHCAIQFCNSFAFYFCVENPELFMKKFLEKLRDARTAQMNYPCLFDESNIRSLLGMLDVTRKGHVTYSQYKAGDIASFSFRLSVLTFEIDKFFLILFSLLSVLIYF